MKIIKKIKVSIIFFGVFFSCNISSAENLGFSAYVHPSDKQIDNNTPYLDLRMKPSETTELEITIKNDSKKTPLYLEFNYANATTNSEGRLEYVPYEVGNDPSLKYKFESIILGPKKEQVAPNDEKTIIFKLTMPKDEFDGYIAGGIEINQVSEEEKEGSLTTEFSYVIGAKISETDNVVRNELEFKKIQMESYHNQSALMLYMANVTSSYVEGLELTVDINSTKKKNKLLSKKVDKMRMAPNSQIAFPIEFQDKPLKSGTYEAQISAKTADGFVKEWNQPFRLNVADGSVYSIDDIEEIQVGKKNYIIRIIIVLVCIAVIFLIIKVAIKFLNLKK